VVQAWAHWIAFVLIGGLILIGLGAKILAEHLSAS
jgi:putative Mn2+ efflux pump MntP